MEHTVAPLLLQQFERLSVVPLAAEARVEGRRLLLLLLLLRHPKKALRLNLDRKASLEPALPAVSRGLIVVVPRMVLVMVGLVTAVITPTVWNSRVLGTAS